MAAALMAGNVEQLPSLHHVAVPAQPDCGLEGLLSRAVPAARQAAIARQRLPGDRLARLLAGALWIAAADALGLPFTPDAVDYPPDSAPRWTGGPYCSLAHSAHSVVLLLAQTPRIGVDVEPFAAASVEDLRLVLPEGLRAPVMDGRLAPTDAWTRIEAVLKASGRGLHGLTDVVFESDATAVMGLQRWHLQSVDVAARTHCCCALPESASEPVRVYQHTVDSLLRLL
jgi:phosphopantetheinyl transferase